MKKYLHIVLMLFVGTSHNCVAAETVDDVSKLNIYGSDQHSVCTPKNLKAFKRSLESLEIKKKWLLWRAIHIMACGKIESSNVTYVASVLAPQIRVTVEGTGQSPSYKAIKRSDISIDNLFAVGDAYDASISKIDNRVQLSYWPNEVCVVHRDFEYFSGKWWLISIDEACD